jgi:hypothetical protein
VKTDNKETQSRRNRLLGPTTQFDSEGDSQFGKLKHVGEAELVGNIDTAGSVIC